MTLVMRRMGSDSVTLKFKEVTKQTSGEQTSCLHSALFNFDIYETEGSMYQAHIVQGPEDARIKSMVLGGGKLRKELELIILQRVLSLWPNAKNVTTTVGV